MIRVRWHFISDYQHRIRWILNPRRTVAGALVCGGYPFVPHASQWVFDLDQSSLQHRGDSAARYIAFGANYRGQELVYLAIDSSAGGRNDQS